MADGEPPTLSLPSSIWKPLYKRNKLAQINKTLSHLRKKYHNDSGSNSLVNTNDRKPEGKVTVEWEG